MGFTSNLSEVALKEYKTVQASIDAILAGKGILFEYIFVGKWITLGIFLCVLLLTYLPSQAVT